MLTRCNAIIENNECDGIFYGYSRVDQDGKILLELKPNVEPRLYTMEDSIDSELLADFLGRNPRTGEWKNLRISVCICCLKLKTIRKANLQFVSERQYISEDTYFYLQLFPHLAKVYLLDEIYYHYVQNTGSLTFSYSEDRYQRQKQFYLDSLELVKRQNLSPIVAERLADPFLSNVISCLKMEAGNIKNAGWTKSFQKIKTICSDEVLRKVVAEYPSHYLPNTWKLFFLLINRKHYFLLSILLSVQFCLKGI